MIAHSALKSLSYAVLVLACSFSAVEQGAGQTLNAYGGEMELLGLGQTYTLLPVAHGDRKSVV